jgi:hypothetical protein
MLHYALHTTHYTHTNSVMTAARCLSATVKNFFTVNVAIFPTSQFLSDFSLFSFEDAISMVTSRRVGSIIEHRPTVWYCSFSTLHNEPK